MNPEQNQEVEVDTTNNEGEGEATVDESISVPKGEYDKLNQTLGSLKRELKDLKKSKEETKEETPKKNQVDEIGLLREKLDKQALRNAGVTHQEDIELAKKTAKKWNVDIDDVLGDEDFKVKLEKQQSARANVEATSGVRGGAGNSQAKNTPEYWIAKNKVPTPQDVPDRKSRVKIVKAFMANSKTSKTFYND